VHDILLVLHDQDGFRIAHGRVSSQRFRSTFAFSTAAMVLLSSISPSMTRWTISLKGMRSTFKNSSSSNCWDSMCRPFARKRYSRSLRQPGEGRVTPMGRKVSGTAPVSSFSSRRAPATGSSPGSSFPA
ncbi:CDP-diacylglycerol--glycerol-3-phosphate 3-phosphatidyltransferase, partial [Dysosmobacter welbionis]